MREGQQLIQVVPRMTPIRCGVSDFALFIAGELEASFGIRSSIVALNSNERPAVPLPIIHCTAARLLEACLSLSEGRNGYVLVHLSGYGYAQDGAPAQLADALRKARTDGGFRIAVFFHELSASGMPWRSAFWHSRKQKEVIRRIAEECDLPVTNTHVHLEWLEKETRRPSATPIQCMPVFSQVGEALQPVPFDRRDPVLAVFGQRETRQRAYRRLATLGDTLRKLEIREILDIGLECEAPGELAEIPVSRMGELASEDVARQFSRAKFGFVPFPPALLGKSGVFAGYCAHGVIPIAAEQFSGEPDGLRDGIHVLSPSTAMTAKESDFAECSRAAWCWYSGHSLSHHAAIYAQWLNGTKFTSQAAVNENE